MELSKGKMNKAEYLVHLAEIFDGYYAGTDTEIEALTAVDTEERKEFSIKTYDGFYRFDSTDDMIKFLEEEIEDVKLQVGD